MLRKIIKGIKHPEIIFNHIKAWYLKNIKGVKSYADYRYKQCFGRSINWDNPVEMNEKIRWIEFNTDTVKWTQLADKYRVRGYLEGRGYGDILVKLYGKWDRAEDIDFSKLPNQFVIKTNHGCGSVYIVSDKRTANLEEIRLSLSKDLKNRFGFDSAEPHYLNINPVIIAEELLQQDNSFSTSLVDYKFYCVYGQPLYCAIMFNRNVDTHKYEVKLFDMEWKDCSDRLDEKVKLTNITVPKPKNLESMIAFCKDVCAEFPFVRMDFYEVNGKLYFGEFTFTPAACTGGSLSKDLCYEIGSKIKLPKHI